MANFDLPKAVNEIQGSKPLPAEWYLMTIVEEPEIRPNKAGTAENLVLTLRTEHDVPEFSGRKFTKYLQWPSDEDEGEFTARGQKKSDAKMEQLIRWSAAFNGVNPDGPAEKVSERMAAAGMASAVVFDVGARANVWVAQTLNEETQEIENEIPFFSVPKVVG